MTSFLSVSYTALPFAAAFLYLVAAGMQYLSFINRIKLHLLPIWLVSAFAFMLHAFWLHHVIDLPMGQNIHFFNMLSFMLWLMVGILVLSGLRQAFQNLSLLVFPLAAFSILLILFFPTKVPLQSMSGHPGEWLHIWLAGLTLSVICMAALQAIFLYIQDRLLHRYQHLPNLIKKMPALESMEKLLFLMITAGFILLTVVCISSIYFFPGIFQPPLLKKTLLVFATWGIFFVLLLGRYLFGWRGKKAIRYTLAGFFLLIIVYFARLT